MKRAICLLLAMVVCFSMFSGCKKEKPPATYENKANAQYSDFEPLLQNAAKRDSNLVNPTDIQIESWVESERTTRVNLYFQGETHQRLKASCRILHDGGEPEYIVDSVFSDPYYEPEEPRRYFFNMGSQNISFAAEDGTPMLYSLADPDIEDFLLKATKEICPLIWQDFDHFVSVRETISSKQKELQVNLYMSSMEDFLEFANLFCERFEKNRTYQSILFSLIDRKNSMPKSASFVKTITLRPEGDTLVSMFNKVDIHKPQESDYYTKEFDYDKKRYLKQPFFAEHDFNVRLGHTSRPATKDDYLIDYPYMEYGAKIIDVKNPYLSVYTDPLGVLDRDIEIGHTICRMLPTNARYIVKGKVCLFIIPVGNDPQPDELREAYRSISRATKMLATWKFSTLPRSEINFEIVTEGAREVYYRGLDNNGQSYLHFAGDGFKEIMQPIIDEEEGKQP